MVLDPLSVISSFSIPINDVYAVFSALRFAILKSERDSSAPPIQINQESSAIQSLS